MLINLDFESDVAIYEQLRWQIIEGIVTGKLKPGDTLPSVRQLASDVGVNMHTVNKAYTFLKQDGYIIVHRQKGVVVADIPPPVTEEFIARLKSNIKPQIAEAILRGIDEKNLISIIKQLFSELKG